ncbi:TetR/AcrR family transcriptional regulator [Chondromyces apiculatus]|uniref:Transcriptional regulator, TetR family n=1 Tax=Chondromyces apiculatus DSM 436 TaxID=1192034 RepID=A0A017TD60_9BACT|nr:TetR/AcrR family transcriptional regulator [Chondromyces apiculatus]EYF07228.1 Transcriptional regulator, TetR family [Chondromyces apiculatus DSM 436]
MARTKEFDREQALDRAMHVFWTKGYEATSLGDLLGAMGIARQSLYDTFGDKHALFLEALKRYSEQGVGAVHSCLDTAPSVRRAIRDMFEAIVDQSEGDKRRGCLGVSASVELAPHDPEVARFLVARQRGLEETFYRALERARTQGEIAASKDTRALARFLTSALIGLRVSATVDPSSQALRDMVRITLQALD